jgi:hypothetical protein
MANLGWFILGNISGAIAITAFWIIVGSAMDKKPNDKKETDKGDEN